MCERRANSSWSSLLTLKAAASLWRRGREGGREEEGEGGREGRGGEGRGGGGREDKGEREEGNRGRRNVNRKAEPSAEYFTVVMSKLCVLIACLETTLINLTPPTHRSPLCPMTSFVENSDIAGSCKHTYMKIIIVIYITITLPLSLCL